MYLTKGVLPVPPIVMLPTIIIGILGLGLDRDYVKSTEGILPATKFAVDAYVNFVQQKSLLEGITSSLTELFAPKIHKERISGMLENYDFQSSE